MPMPSPARRTRATSGTSTTTSPTSSTASDRPRVLAPAAVCGGADGMARPSDEKLIAYFDDALDPAERDVVARWLEHDVGVRLRGAALGESAALLRAVY